MTGKVLRASNEVVQARAVTCLWAARVMSMLEVTGGAMTALPACLAVMTRPLMLPGSLGDANIKRLAGSRQEDAMVPIFGLFADTSDTCCTASANQHIQHTDTINNSATLHA